MEIPEAGKKSPGQEREGLEHVAQPVATVEPLARMPAQNLPLVVPTIDNGQALQDVMSHPFGGNDGQTSRIPRQTVPKKALRADGSAQKRIVVEIDEMLLKALDPVHVELDGTRTERRQVRRGDVVGMTDHMQFGMVRIEPRRQMAPGNEMDAVHPGCEPFHAAKPVAQRIPVAVTLFGSIRRSPYLPPPVIGGIRRDAGTILQELRPPGRIAPVHPGYHEIYLHLSVPHDPQTIR